MFTDNVHATTTVLLYNQTVTSLWFKGLSLALQLLKLNYVYTRNVQELL